ncbi:HEAT repeat domain-containing protein [Paenibacillus pinihumi]|uniref:HEAT repeat domain-containing protein n=1 Tax=Paenibacillus pinihumi TaxID=669462 RepID=UPI00041D41C9|nr:HEAT repeat domain-containing protein [Paenibacillus pinihumi]
MDTKYLLTDEQMTQFITKGYLVLQNDLSQQLHENVMKRIYNVIHEEGNPGNNILPRVPDIQQFFDTPAVRGALTSVLGPDYYMHPHRHCHYNQPGNQAPGGGQWHKDGYWSSMRSHRPWWAMVFYYTQDVTEELGPTAIMPGTQYYEKFLGDRGETILPTGKAGTMVLVHFDLWHKASLNVSQYDRYMLKFQFVRLRAPELPSWNHKKQELIIPEGASIVHRSLWQDVWDWLRGDKTAGANGQQAEEKLLQKWANELASPDASVREQAADGLGTGGEAAAGYAPVLGQLLSDPVETVALNAAYALGRLGPKGAEELLGLLEEGTNLAALRAAYGLQASGAEAVPGLVDLLRRGDARRRALTAFALGSIGSAARCSIPFLIDALNDESAWVRRNAAEALGMIGEHPEQVVPALAKALITAVEAESATISAEDDPHEQSQGYITNKIGYTAALSLLRTGKLGDAKVVVHALNTALNSKDRYVRAYAFEALAHLRTEEAIDVLVRAYRSARWCPDTHKASAF